MNFQTHGPIDEYLNLLGAQLTKLPAQKQDEVRRETQAHLDSLIAANKTADSTEAVTTALRQFGDPVKVGRQIASEFRRDEIHEKQATWAVRLCVAAVVPWLLYSIVMASNTIFRHFFTEDSRITEPLYGYIYPMAAITVYLLALVICWRAYHLRLWACALLALYAFHLTSLYLASTYYFRIYGVDTWRHSTYDQLTILFRSGFVSIGFLPALLLIPMFLFRRRHLKLRV